MPVWVLVVFPFVMTVALVVGMLSLGDARVGVAQVMEEVTGLELRYEGADGVEALTPLRSDGLLEAGKVYAVLEGLDSETDVRVVGEDGAVLAMLRVRPRHHQVAVAFSPSGPALEQLDGLWKSFGYQPGPMDEGLRGVSVGGSFNNWSSSVHPMTAQAEGGYWTMVRLDPGVHYYKLVLDRGGEPVWMNDPASDVALEEPDGHGGVNSAFLLGPDVRRLPAPMPDHIQSRGLGHDGGDRGEAALAGEGMARLAVRVQPGDIEEALVWTDPEGAGDWVSAGLDRGVAAGGFERWGGFAPLEADRGLYYFELIDGDARVFYARGDAVVDREAAEILAYRAPEASKAVTPDWARDVVWYQIFPERFRNGDPSNDPGAKDYETLIEDWRSDWWETQPGEVAGEENFYEGAGNVWRRRYGGDLQGVKEKLGYLKELGVTAIYFNPIFEGSSMHKYDASDFRHIDDNFGVVGDWPVLSETDDPSTWMWTGSDRVFLDFLAEAKSQGFRVVIDGVFNHVGRNHYAFIDVLENGKRSKYAGWFAITDWGDPSLWGHPEPYEVHGKPGGIQWVAWDGPSGHLPKFKQDPVLGLAAGPRQHMLDITRRWMAPDGDVSKGIDGWRLDVANEVPMVFWRDWRRLVKSINPDAFIAGEIWSDATVWLEGDQFDAVMNYRFADAAHDFFVDREQAITASAFGERLLALSLAYPFEVSLVQMNLFDSHDTDRLASMLMNPDRPYDGANRLQDTGPDYHKGPPSEEAYQRMIQAVVCQMTYLGAPMIYYGNEVGMYSPDDPSNRMPMWWEDLMPYADPDQRIREDVFEAHQRLIAVRTALRPLRRGVFRVQSADDAAGVLVYERVEGDERVVVALNRSPEARTVRVELDPDRAHVDWFESAHVRVVMDEASGRPKAIAVARIGLRGTIDVALEPWGSAILAPVPPAAVAEGVRR